MIIRIDTVAAEEQVELLLPLIQQLAIHENFPFSANPESLSTCLLSEGAISRALLAYCDNEVAGYAIYSPKLAGFAGHYNMYLDHLFVLPEKRRRGVARSLLSAVADASRDQGATQLYLRVDAMNANALEFYEQIGGKVIEEARLIVVPASAFD